MTALLLALSLAASATGGTCPVISGGAPALDQVDSADRARFIRVHLLDEAPRARAYSLAWWAAFSLGTAVQLVAASASDPGTQVDLLIGAVSTGLGVIALPAQPLTVLEPLPPEREGCAALAALE